MITDKVPEVGDVVTGFSTATMKKGHVVDENYVVESVVSRPDGYGHGPGDVYPGGYGIVVRKLTEDGEYDPEGQELDFLMRAGGSGGNNGKINIVGKMERTVSFSKM